MSPMNWKVMDLHGGFDISAWYDEAKGFAKMSFEFLVFDPNSTQLPADVDMGGFVPAEWNYSQYAKHMCDYDAKKAKIIANWT